jgi:hypothetical protein
MATLPDPLPAGEKSSVRFVTQPPSRAALRSFAINKNKRDEETRWAMLITAPANSTGMPSLGSASRVRYGRSEADINRNCAVAADWPPGIGSRRNQPPFIMS